MKQPKVDLIQPRHIYAPPASQIKQGHIYMPTSLLTEGARLLASGIDIEMHDENIKSRVVSCEHVGVNLLGSPYIPEVIRLQSTIDKEVGKDVVYLLGGQVVSGLTRSQFRKLFGDNARNGNDDKTLALSLGISAAKLLAPERTSLILAYEKIPDEIMREYLSREFSLYVSQGCKFACDFCAAVRTFRDPATGVIQRVKEMYRDPQIIERDLGYLVQRAKRLGITELKIYMSNLDVFQTPTELLRFALAVQHVKSNNLGFIIRLRGLATAESFLKTRSQFPQAIEKLVEAGFHTVGFGVDGMTPHVWRAIGKGMNTEEKCLDAICSCKQDFGITPEILMVFGHSSIDTEETLRLAYEFTLDMVDNYGAVPRPHVAKSFIPCNNGWTDPANEKAVSVLMEHPTAFQALDFTALASELTHPDEKLRELVNEHYVKICSIPGNTTQYVKPITPYLTLENAEEIKKFNEEKYDR